MNAGVQVGGGMHEYVRVCMWCGCVQPNAGEELVDVLGPKKLLAGRLHQRRSPVGAEAEGRGA